MPSFEKIQNDLCNEIRVQILGKEIPHDEFPTSYSPHSLRVDGKGNFHLIDTSQRSTWKGRIISLIQYFVYGSSHKANDRALSQAIDRFEAAILKTASNNPFTSLDNACKTIASFKADPDYSKDSKIANKIATFKINTLTKLAENGNVDAQFKLALHYSLGNGCGKNKIQAFFWHKKAADNGHLRSQNIIGNYFKNGIGTPTDKQMAVVYFRKAAERGDPIARFNLACCYENGVGVDQDKQTANKWYQLFEQSL